MLTSIVKQDVETILGLNLPWERFAGKRVLITGAAGFLATYLVETLLALDKAPREVVGVVRNAAKARARFAHHSSSRVLTIAEGDVSQSLDLDGHFDFIIHAASQASPKFYLVDPVGTLRANVLGADRLLERARADKAEAFLFVSSGEVYGETTVFPTAERDYGYLDPATVRACYAEAKRVAETMCVAMHQQYKVPAHIVRPFHTYGPGLAPDDGRVFADLVADIVARRDLVIKSDGSARRAFCYVTDAIAGIFTVLLTGEPAVPYNVGNDQAELSIRELAEALVAAFPERQLKAIVNAGAQDPNYAKSPISRNCPNVDALRKLGWAPRVSVADGFRRTVLSVEETNAGGMR